MSLIASGFAQGEVKLAVCLKFKHFLERFMSTLREAFVAELRDVLDAERQLLKALPIMAKAAKNEELRNVFDRHRNQTEGQIVRLERVFEAFSETARAKKCKGMQGLV